MDGRRKEKAETRTTNTRNLLRVDGSAREPARKIGMPRKRKDPRMRPPKEAELRLPHLMHFMGRPH